MLRWANIVCCPSQGKLGKCPATGQPQRLLLLVALVFAFSAIGASTPPKGTDAVLKTAQRLQEVAQKLQQALSASSLRLRQRAATQAEQLLSRLPPSPVTNAVRQKLQQARKVGLASEEGQHALREALATTQGALRLLRQPVPETDFATAYATLQRVLSSPEFRDPLAPLRLWLQRVLEHLAEHAEWLLNQLWRLLAWLWRLVEPLWRWFLRVVEAIALWVWGWLELLFRLSPVLGWGLVAALVALILCALFLFLARWWQRYQHNLVPSAVVHSLVTPEQLLQEAERAAQRGDYLTAVRQGYRALLLLLDRMGFIRFREQRTNWEYLSEVRAKAPSSITGLFQEATRLFDRCFYARHTATAQEFGLVREWALTLRAHPTKPSGNPPSESLREEKGMGIRDWGSEREAGKT